jgi:mersacidin/lichenicidin family type 2 lantibiotic
MRTLLESEELPMRSDEIIRIWKNEDDRKKDSRSPANPAGELELTDEELQNIGGGFLDASCMAASCNGVTNQTCPADCSILSVLGLCPLQ